MRRQPMTDNRLLNNIYNVILCVVFCCCSGREFNATNTVSAAAAAVVAAITATWMICVKSFSFVDGFQFFMSMLFKFNNSSITQSLALCTPCVCVCASVICIIYRFMFKIFTYKEKNNFTNCGCLKCLYPIFTSTSWIFLKGGGRGAIWKLLGSLLLASRARLLL